MKPTHLFWRCLYHLATIISTAAMVVCLLVHFQSLRMIAEASLLSMMLTIFVILLVYLSITWLAIIFHELGHALAAWFVGFRVDLIVVGPLKWIRLNNRLRCRVNKHSFAPGFVVATPLVSQNLVGKYVVFILAGPLFTLLLAIVSLQVCLSLLDKIDFFKVTTSLESEVDLYQQLFFIAGFSFIMNSGCMLLSIIPMFVRNKYLNDGGLFLWLMQQRQQLNLRDQKLGTLGFMMIEGVRPNQWNREELLQCVGTKSLGTASDVHACLMGYYYFLDCGEIHAAEAMLDKALEYSRTQSSEVRPSVLIETVYFNAFYHNDVAQAAENLKLCEGNSEVEKPTCHRAEAAFKLVEKQYEQCLHQAKAALIELKYTKDLGGALAEADWINAIITRCKTTMSQTESESPASTPPP